MNTCDLLVFGAHPDDVEIGAGGIIAKHQQAERRTIICDLTEAELSSNGTVPLRRKETEKASQCLGVTERINLGFPDRGLIRSHEQIRKVTQLIRQLKPKTVLAPYEKDRHPDHQACSLLVQEAVFNATIAKYNTPEEEPPHWVDSLYFYFIHNSVSPSLIVDISDVYEKKQGALAAYQSQFFQGEVQTVINQPTFIRMIEGRDLGWGNQIGVTYGEALLSTKPLVPTLLV